MICKTCGETMIGDGYKTALHCPSVEAWDVEPDADPIHCAPCPYCDGTGDVHSPDGEWRGVCTCGDGTL